MSSTRWLLLISAVALLAFAVQAALYAQDDDNDAAGDDAADARMAALQERAHAFRDAYAARNAEALWDLITEESRQGFDQDLSTIKRNMRELPEERRDNALPGLSVTPNDFLALSSGRDFFAWLISELDEDHLELVGRISLQAERVRFESEERARLTWQAPDDADREARNLAREMPRYAVLENDLWHFVVSSD